MKRIKEFLKKIFKVEYIKYYAIGLVVLIVLVVLLLQQCSIRQQQSQINNLTNQLSEYNTNVVKLKDGLYKATTRVGTNISRKDREFINKDVDEIIKKNKLDAVYASQVTMGMKIQELITDKTKPVIIVNNSAEPNQPIPQEVVDNCNTCLSKTKIRIPFEGQKGNISVAGWAETGEKIGLPGKYELDIKLLKELTLNIVLTQGKDKKWTTLVSDPTGTMEVLGIRSVINVKPFKPSFKERIMIPVGIAAGGQIILLRMGLYFELTSKVSLGLDTGGIINYRSLPNSDGFIGIGFIIRPF